MKYEGRIDDDDKFLGSMKAVGRKEREERGEKFMNDCAHLIMELFTNNFIFPFHRSFFLGMPIFPIGSALKNVEECEHMCLYVSKYRHIRWHNEIIIGCWKFMEAK